MTCARCGTIASEGLERCKRCGAALARPEQAPEWPLPTPRSPTNRGEAAQRAAGIVPTVFVAPRPAPAPPASAPSGWGDPAGHRPAPRPGAGSPSPSSQPAPAAGPPARRRPAPDDPAAGETHRPAATAASASHAPGPAATGSAAPVPSPTSPAAPPSRPAPATVSAVAPPSQPAPTPPSAAAAGAGGEPPRPVFAVPPPPPPASWRPGEDPTLPASGAPSSDPTLAVDPTGVLPAEAARSAEPPADVNRPKDHAPGRRADEARPRLEAPWPPPPGPWSGRRAPRES